MATLLSLLLVGCSVGLGNFAASIGIGLSGVDARTRLKTGIIFGFFEALMPILGLFIGQGLASFAGSIGRYIGAVLLILMGLYGILQAYLEQKREAQQPARPNRHSIRRMLLLGFALSLDNLVVGFALSFFQVPILLTAAVIGIISVSLSLLGLQLGFYLGSRFEEWSEIFGSLVLILIGTALGSGILH